MDWMFWLPVVCSGTLAGASTGLLGTFIVGMRVPLLGVCISHAALAGAVFGGLCGLSGPWLMLPALVGAVATALLLGMLDMQSARIDPNVLLGTLFSLTMGLSFLGLGLYGVYGISDNEVRSLLWGSLNFCRWQDFYIIVLAAAVELVVVLMFYKELRAILFSREEAAAAGVHATMVWTLLLILTSVVLTVNFQTVGGLMIYGLLSNPAVAAFQLVRGFGKSLIASTVLGALSGLGGFLIAAWFDLPTGAMIVLLSSLLIALAAALRHVRR
ncbi:MAG: metal ABC transporter permease [Planctomycetaceae bacterium]|nr:metal ABC transporter permease [Planctomycetaceae bacterium]